MISLQMSYSVHDKGDEDWKGHLCYDSIDCHNRGAFKRNLLSDDKKYCLSAAAGYPFSLKHFYFLDFQGFQAKR